MEEELLPPTAGDGRQRFLNSKRTVASVQQQENDEGLPPGELNAALSGWVWVADCGKHALNSKRIVASVQQQEHGNETSAAKFWPPVTSMTVTVTSMTVTGGSFELAAAKSDMKPRSLCNA